jgi:hypothetical protein
MRRLTIAAICMLVVAVAAAAQVGWDKHRPTKPLPNPSPVGGTRDEIVSAVKALLANNDVTIKSEGVDAQNGSYVITTEPVIFARGLISGTQLGHFAETKNPGLENIVRGRVALRVEIAPTAPTAARVGVYGTFEGLRAGTTTWAAAPSRGILEDRVLRYLVTATGGHTDDGGGADLFDTSGEAPEPR